MVQHGCDKREKLTRARCTHLKRHKGKCKEANCTKLAPSFWTGEKDCAQDISVKSNFKASVKEARLTASGDFIWVLFNRKEQAKATNPEPGYNFRRLVDRSLPHYQDFLGARYPVRHVITCNHGNLDLSYVEMLWRYSAIVGKDAFPVGLHEWPISQDWVKEVSTSPVERSTASKDSSAAIPGPAPGGSGRRW